MFIVYMMCSFFLSGNNLYGYKRKLIAHDHNIGANCLYTNLFSVQNMWAVF